MAGFFGGTYSVKMAFSQHDSGLTLTEATRMAQRLSAENPTKLVEVKNHLGQTTETYFGGSTKMW